MTRSRLVFFAAMTVVVVGVAAGVGALWLSPARAAVGPLVGEALILPADAKFVMGFDVKRFAASPFYERFKAQRGMKPEALAELEAKTGLNPARDLDQIVVAGTGVQAAPAVAVALGHFDLYKLGRAIEASGKAQGTSYEGVTVYNFSEESKQPLSLALVDESTLVLGPTDQVTQALASRTRGETPLKTNTALMARVEKIQPGSTFWMVGDQSLLASLPPSRSRRAGGTMSLPALKGLTVTGDLEPQVSLAVTGEAQDAAAAKQAGRRRARPRRDGEPAGGAEAGAFAARLGCQRRDRGEPRARLGADPLRDARRAPAQAAAGRAVDARARADRPLIAAIPSASSEVAVA